MEYDGTRYKGFQLQAGQPTIQGEIESSLTKFTGEFIRIRGASRTDSGAHAKAGAAAKRKCASCGISFGQFRQSGTLGCPDCYDAFEKQLAPLIERAQNGATHHRGKSPRRAGSSIDRTHLIRQLTKELDQAVAADRKSTRLNSSH